MSVDATTPIRAPISAPTNPCNADSSRNNLTINPSNAPRHFMVPISRNRSVTDINIALAIPTTQTMSDMVLKPMAEKVPPPGATLEDVSRDLLHPGANCHKALADKIEFTLDGFWYS